MNGDHLIQNGLERFRSGGSSQRDRIRESRGDVRQYDQYSRRRSPMPSRSNSGNSYNSANHYDDSHRVSYNGGGPDPNFSRDGYGSRGHDRNGRDRGYDRDRERTSSRYGNEKLKNYREEEYRGKSPSRDKRQGHAVRGLESDQARFERYEKRLINLLDVHTLENFPLEKSKWGVKPKGFEDVTAQRAKLSGYFPLPSAQGSTDTNLEELMKSGGVQDGVLEASLKIDPIDSRAARTVLISNVDFSKVPPAKISNYMNKFLRLIDFRGVAIDENISSTKLAIRRDTLLVELKTSVCATLVLCLNGKRLLANDLGLESFQEYQCSLTVCRPREYVVQCLPPKERESKEFTDDVVDSPCKLTLLIDRSTTETQLQDALTTIAPLRAFKLLREVGTKDSLGIAFAEFYIDPKRYPDVNACLKKTSEYLEQVLELSDVNDARFLCIEFSGDKIPVTSVQDCFIELKTLKGLVRNKFVPFHPKLKVIELINVLTATDYASRETMEFVKEDIQQEASKFGTVVSINIPHPELPIAPGSNIEGQPGIGKVFLEFENDSVALKALMGMAGRTYNDRTILCAFYDHQDYINGVL